MSYINPFIKVNQGGLPRLEAVSVDTTSGSVYKFREHRFLNYPYAGLIIFKLPEVASPTAGDVYFTTGESGSKVLVLDHSGKNVAATNTSISAGGIFIGWYADGTLMLITGV